MLRVNFPKNIQFIFFSLLLLLTVNFAFRVTLFLLYSDLAADATTADILYCLFNVGFLFDLYISLIILVLPYLLTSIPFLKNKDNKKIYTISNRIILLLGIVNIAISSTDLGFFRYYNSRVTQTVFDWTNDLGLMLKVMSNDSTYLPYFITFLAVSGIYAFLQMKIYKKTVAKAEKHFNTKTRLLVFFAFLTLIFFGIRGSFNFHHQPLNMGDAFFSENLFLNQLSTNPVYSLANSYRYLSINYFKHDKEAVDAAFKYLNRKKSSAANPFEMTVEGADSLRPNIVLIFLESMSNAMVSRYHPELNTTPFLDSLAEQGIVFDNFYSAGVHTHNAIFSTFFGLPAVMHNKPLTSLATASQKFYGLPRIMKEKDYHTVFYVTGSKKFDNMNDFLLYNGFDRVVGESNYPFDSVTTMWGVKDITMFNRIISDCDSLYRANKRFFVSALTISAHEGCVVPETFRDRLINTESPYDLYEYSDLALKEFFGSAKSHGWFDNTVFILVGDHGQNYSPVYDLNLNYHRVPLIFYSPQYFEPLAYQELGLQEDIYPTLFGLLDFSYTYNALGTDLFKYKRKYAYFSADKKLGIIDDETFLIYRGKSNISMYAYKDNSIKDLYPENRAKADSMLRFGFSMIQSARYLIENKLTDVDITSKPE